MDTYKIAVLIRDYDFSGGGSQKYCVELTNKLGILHEVDVYTQNIASPSAKVNYYKIPRLLKKPRFINQLLFSWLTKLAIKNSGKHYDIVHSHDTVTHANVYTLHVDCVKTKWSKKSKIGKFLYAISLATSPRMLAYLWLEYKKLTIAPNKQFIVVSGYLERNLLASYPNIKQLISHAPPGVDLNSTSQPEASDLRNNFRKRHHMNEDAYVLLFIAHDFKRKGLNTIIKALEKLENNQIYLLVAGKDNSDKAVFQSELVKKNTLFLGSVTDTNQIYPVADTLVHPTLNDTYGMVVLEAMLHQLSVIVSEQTYCGASEYFNNQEVIILENPKDYDYLSKQIKNLYEKPEARNYMAKNGFNKAQTYTWEKTLEDTLNAYHKALNDEPY